MTQVSLYHERLGLLLTCRDAVDFHENVYLREITVENMDPRERERFASFSPRISTSRVTMWVTPPPLTR